MNERKNDHWHSLANELGAEAPAETEPAGQTSDEGEVQADQAPTASEEESETMGDRDTSMPQPAAVSPPSVPSGAAKARTRPKRPRRENHWGFLAGELGLAQRESPSQETEQAEPTGEAAASEQPVTPEAKEAAPAPAEISADLPTTPPRAAAAQTPAEPRQQQEIDERHVDQLDDEQGERDERWLEAEIVQGEALDELDAGIDTGEDEDETEEAAESRPRRRRRRRRRRGRDTDEQSRETGGDEEDVTRDEEDETSDESAEVTQGRAQDSDESEQSDLDEDRSEGGDSRRRRRRGSRRRDRDKDTQAADAEFAERPATPEREEDVDDVDDVDDLEQGEGRGRRQDASEKAKHRKIPTWQEAIGTIIKVNMDSRSRSSGGGRRGDRRGDGRRGEGRRGGRGRGRGRSS